MSKESIHTNDAPKAIGPYSQAIKTETFLFVSGQVPINPKTGQVEEKDIKGQTRQSMENLKNILKEGGLTFNDVVKTTAFLKDLNNFDAFNEVYASYFNNSLPARSCVEVSRLPKDVLVEVEVIAIINK